MKIRNNSIVCAVLVGVFTIIMLSFLNWRLTSVHDDYMHLKEVKAGKTMTAAEYEGMTRTVQDNKEMMDAQLARQYENITELERSMELYVKESVLSSISHNCLDCGTTFDNFYVTKEGSIKSDYSVQIKGTFPNIVNFVDKLCKDNAGISVGEFSLRQDYDIEYLTRFFDKSNALIWYNGSIGGLPSLQQVEEAEKQAKQLSEEQTNKAIAKLYEELAQLQEEIAEAKGRLEQYKNQYEISGDLIVSSNGETLRYRIIKTENQIATLQQTILMKEAELSKLETKNNLITYTRALPTSDKVKYVLTLTFRV